jgi:hypothetical protein
LIYRGLRRAALPLFAAIRRYVSIKGKEERRRLDASFTSLEKRSRYPTHRPATTNDYIIVLLARIPSSLARARARETIGSLFAHPPTNINDHRLNAAMRRRAPRRRFVREMVIGILLGPVTRFEWSPRDTGASGPRARQGGGQDRFKRSQGGRDSSTPRQPHECSRIWRKIVTANRIYLGGRATACANNAATI